MLQTLQANFGQVTTLSLFAVLGIVNILIRAQKYLLSQSLHVLSYHSNITLNVSTNLGLPSDWFFQHGFQIG